MSLCRPGQFRFGHLHHSLSPALSLAAALLLASAAEASAPPEQARDWDKERQFWSFKAPLPQPKPAVQNTRWPRTPLDHFILARLEQRQLDPAAEADRRSLIRRATFDLTGLPPTPDEIDEFLRDRSRDAYERLVNRLIASPRFGERLASVWLPLARYAEDQAHQVGSDTKFFYPNAWRYREWVINSFNSDLPYDRFVALQIAADRIEGTNSVNLAALGFIGLGPKYYNRNRLEVQADEWEDRVDTVSRTVLGLTVACARCHDHKFDPITTEDYYALAGVFASTRMVNRTPEGTSEKNDAQSTNMSPATVHIVMDGDKVENLNVFLRGNVERKGAVVERRFLRVLSPGEPEPFKDGSGRRELADALTDPANPLTARVIVNRLWTAFFGQGLVPTPSNFGHSGQPPSHPELLDDLTARFVANGWSIKSLVREMLLSSTYRQSSAVPAEVRAADPGNELFSRMNRRRLTIEGWRDALLFATGELDWRGGKSLELDDPENLRRTVYARVSRLKLNDVLMQFDYPDANVHAETRSVTTSSLQKLFLLNSDFMLERARTFAARLGGNTDEQKIEQAYSILFGRSPSEKERGLAVDFLNRPGGLSRWEQYAQILLASNEMMYVD